MKQNILAVCAWSAAVFLLSGLLDTDTDTATSRNLRANYENVPFNSTDLPAWLSTYIEWHQLVRSDPEVFRNTKVLLIDEGAGGLGDRLKHIPYFLWLASKHERVLLIHWYNQCGIDEFFQPNLLNWTATPDILSEVVHLNKRGDNKDYFQHFIDSKDMEEHKSLRVLGAFGNHQSLVKGFPLVLGASNGNKKVFKYIFKSVFRLAKPVQELLGKTKKEIGLGDDYIGVHLRARYPKISKILDSAGTSIDQTGITNVTAAVKNEIKRISDHAISCTKEASGKDDVQVYFASDTVLALELQHELDEKVVYLKTDAERVHFANPNQKKMCQQLYPAIVDLWLLADAKCIGFGVGGYGALATMMSDFDCWTIHQFNSMLSQHFKKDTNVFNSENGTLPTCLLPEATTSEK